MGHTQALGTLGKLEQVASNVRLTMDKLVGIRADLIRTEKDWKSWTFTELVEALRQWIERNPLQPGDKDGHKNLSGESISWKQRITRSHVGVYIARVITIDLRSVQKLLISASVREF